MSGHLGRVRGVDSAALLAVVTTVLVSSAAGRSWPLFYLSAAALVALFVWLVVAALVALTPGAEEPMAEQGDDEPVG